MSKNRISLLIADDTLIARAGWARILEPVDDIEVVGEADTIQGAVTMAKDLQPDVLLMDLKWFGDETAGARAIALIKQELPQIKIIALTAYEYLVADARKAGAEAALTKGFSVLELIEAIRSVSKLDTSSPLFSSPTVKVEAPDELTNREIEVLALMLERLTDTAIANELGISVVTTKKHVSSILSKLHAKNRAQAILIGIKEGWI